MSGNINLPYFQHIDTRLGLKYLNGNRKLYLKILNNFLERYRDFEIENLNREKLKDTIHTIKGLSSTLGMISLSRLAKIIHNNSTPDGLLAFSKALSLVINELQIELNEDTKKSILIADNISEDIDILIESLNDNCDPIVAINEIDALEIIVSENISLALLSTDIAYKKGSIIYNELYQKDIPIILLVNTLYTKNIEYNNNYIEKPLNINKLKKSIKSILY
jgi:HPt (histidine-containing phosphotransfer) domain-containing protein